MPKQGYTGPLEQIDECCWRIPRSYKCGMKVEGRIFADERLIEQIRHDQAPEQVANVSFLPGIQMASLAMPDIHWGYGFCIGGVCATDPAEGGVVSPGGVGYDINCGVRLVRTNLSLGDVRPRLANLMDALFRQIPAGVGRGGQYLFDHKELRRLLREGCGYLQTRGWATPGDLDHTEAGGCLPGADPDELSQQGHSAGRRPVRHARLGQSFSGSAGGRGNDRRSGRPRPGPGAGRVCVMIHSGSRGLGYQVCDDALQMLRNAPAKYGIDIPDRQLACAPVHSPEGQKYLAAMRAAANFAWANRQLLMWQARETFAEFFGRSWESLQMNLVYDVATTWIGEARFLQALNFCMLLPGPEAQQLATYLGWLLNGVRGGLIAGLLFILPGAVAIMGLSLIYAALGHVGLVQGLFFGLKAAVLAIVVDALLRIGRRALKTAPMRALAGGAFIGIFFLDLPFPLIILGAAFFGYFATRLGFSLGLNGAQGAAEPASALGEETPEHTQASLPRALKTAAIWLTLWLAPVALLFLLRGPGDVFTQIAVFFSKMAVVGLAAPMACSPMWRRPPSKPTTG